MSKTVWLTAGSDAPEMPEVPNVVPFEDEPAKAALRLWCEDYARARSAWAVGELAERLKNAESRAEREADAASRLRWPDTTGGQSW